MRKIALTLVVAAALGTGASAQASEATPQRDAFGVLTCTLAAAGTLGTRPYPTTPFNTVSYALATGGDALTLGVCIAI
ncbi:MAG TPA: hypothetical protein VF519_16235 [Mycobacteriales bacterium]|jgi:putative alpha-1,2-mannosidase